MQGVTYLRVNSLLDTQASQGDNMELDREEFHEFDLGYDFNAEGPRPYDFEPAARQPVLSAAQRRRLNGMRGEIEAWGEENINRIGNVDW